MHQSKSKKKANPFFNHLTLFAPVHIATQTTHISNSFLQSSHSHFIIIIALKVLNGARTTVLVLIPPIRVKFPYFALFFLTSGKKKICNPACCFENSRIFLRFSLFTPSLSRRTYQRKGCNQILYTSQEWRQRRRTLFIKSEIAVLRQQQNAEQEKKTSNSLSHHLFTRILHLCVECSFVWSAVFPHFS